MMFLSNILVIRVFLTSGELMSAEAWLFLGISDGDYAAALDRIPRRP
jgi:hypothetical protein